MAYAVVATRSNDRTADCTALARCTVNARGQLENCAVTNENPSDQGFGDAALRLSKLFKMRPETKDGAPVSGGKITIPIAFRLPKD